MENVKIKLKVLFPLNLMISILFKRLEIAFAKNNELLTKVTTQHRVKIFFYNLQCRRLVQEFKYLL